MRKPDTHSIHETDFAEMGPVELQRFLSAKAQELSLLQISLEHTHREAETAEFKWTEHFDKVMDDLTEEGEKLPGEERCIGIARRRAGWSLWSEHRRGEREVKKLERTATLINHQISAAQSAAKLLMAVEA